MAQLGYSQKEADILLQMGKLDPSTYEMAKRSGAFSSMPSADTTGDALNATVKPEYTALPDQAPAVPMDSVTSAQASPVRVPAAESKPEAGHVDVSKIALATPAKPDAAPKELGLSGIQKGYSDQMSGLSKEAQIASKQAEQEAAYLSTSIKEMERVNAEQQKRTLEYQQESEAAMADYKKSSDEYQKAAAIDPNRFWNNIGTGQKITAAISIALGAIGGAMTGKGGNVALDIINSSIDRDIDAQKQAASAAKSGMDLKGNVFAQLRQKYGDDTTASLAQKAMALDIAKMNIDRTAKLSGGQAIQAKAQVLKGQIEVEQEKILIPLRQAMQTQAVLRKLSGGQTMTAADLAALPEDKAEKFVQGNGFSGLAHTKEDAKAIKDKQAAAADATAGLDELLSLASKSGREFLPSEAKARADTLKNMLKGKLRTLIVGPGAVSESEWKILDAVVANPTDLTQLNAISRLKTLRESINKSVLTEAQVRGAKVTDVNFKSR